MNSRQSATFARGGMVFFRAAAGPAFLSAVVSLFTVAQLSHVYTIVTFGILFQERDDT